MNKDDAVPAETEQAQKDQSAVWAAQWETVSGLLRAEIGEAAYQSWLKPMTVRAIVDGEVRISVPTRFMRDWIVAHYTDRLADLWSAENADVKGVDVFIQSEREASSGTVEDRAPAPVDKPQNNGVGRPSGDISGPLDRRFDFEHFVVGKPNEFAYAAARRVAEASSTQFNPLFLYGGVGLGKTHLMHAIAWHIHKSTPERNVIYLSAEKFMYRFIRALREKNTVDFKDQFRSVDVLMIDDVQFISGKDSTQEEFFHTFNALVDQGRQIVISSDKSPSDLEGMEERLISRLNCGLVADIHATTYELRLGILQSKAEQLSVVVPPKVMEFLAHKITANVRELEGALNRVVAHAQLVGREISLEATQDVLHDLLRANDRRVTIEEIQKRVASHFNIRTSDMHSARRARSVARPRQVAMYLAKQLTARSLPEIGRKFGGRDHTTVMHAVKKVDELREHDPSFAEDVDLLRRMLEG
ncbi:MAG: chromosomal replication initiator protein DnaA [Rhodospirillales bacterium]|nr:chromosomal replication initiator protein DnaA [Alphaproteobacteria bacterium]MBL6948362.1 chromosomal replication initiator protein DnaA [Rhodospirillales bacterium]